MRTVEEITDWRLCLGCGACAYICPEQKIRLIDFVDHGVRPVLANTQCGSCRACLDVCPAFEKDQTQSHQRTGAIESLQRTSGPVLEVWEGHAADPAIRFAGSSGGLITALSAYCLEQAGMHGVLHIAQDPNDPLRNKTVLSRTRAELMAGTGSRYAPASACDRLDLIEKAPGPCVFVGQPSEVTALRKAERLRPELARRVGVTISFFCAGSPARRGLIELLKSMGVDPARAGDIRYRGNGWPGKFTVRLKGGNQIVAQCTYQESWGFVQAYRPFSTHLCPDSTGEDADISCGDPWYRQVGEGELGSSLVVVRSETGRRMVQALRESGYAHLEPAEPWKLLRSQVNLFQKRGAIWGRVATLRALGLPAPKLKGFSLFKSWCGLSLEDKLRSTAGTLRRIVMRNYFKPLRLKNLPEASELREAPLGQAALSDAPGPAELHQGESEEQSAPNGRLPSVLVAIASYGRAQDHHLEKVLAEYRKFKFPTKVVVLSDKLKPVPGAEVIAGLPSANPYSLPFAHKKVFGDNVDRYDLFIYTEDDSLITEKHLEAFLNAQARLADDEIAGFVRSETSPDGSRYITSIHHHFRWLPESVVERKGELFAQFSNEHSGCFMVTRQQLKRAIASGGFLVPPHAEVYGMLETAASDLYTQCGLTRFMSLSRLEEFVIPHLPNKYYADLGISWDELQAQKKALIKAQGNGAWCGKLFEPQSRAPRFAWSKDLYERADEQLLKSIPPQTKSVLSIGASRGDNETWLKNKGLDVCAVPVDIVFGALLRQRGIRTVEGSLAKVIERLGEERFDLVLLADVLHLVEDPVDWLTRLRGLLRPGGTLSATVANTTELMAWWRHGRTMPGMPLRPRFDQCGVQTVTAGRLRRWCRAAGLDSVQVVPVVYEPRQALRKWGLKKLEPAFAWRFILSGRAR